MIETGLGASGEGGCRASGSETDTEPELQAL